MGGGAKRKRKKTFLVMTLYDRTVLIITVKFIQLQDRTGGGGREKRLFVTASQCSQPSNHSTAHFFSKHVRMPFRNDISRRCDFVKRWCVSENYSFLQVRYL